MEDSYLLISEVLNWNTERSNKKFHKEECNHAVAFQFLPQSHLTIPEIYELKKIQRCHSISSVDHFISEYKHPAPFPTFTRQGTSWWRRSTKLLVIYKLCVDTVGCRALAFF